MPIITIRPGEKTGGTGYTWRLSGIFHEDYKSERFFMGKKQEDTFTGEG